MKRALAMAFIGFAIAAPAPIAFADDDDYRGGFRISRAEAIDIARDNGMNVAQEIERDDGKWELEGCTYDRSETEIDIHGQSGHVLELEIDDRDDDC